MMTTIEGQPGVRFDEAEHAYFENGTRVLSVTQILSCEGVVDFSMVKKEILEHKRDIGNAAHAATHFMDINTLDWATIDPAVEGYVNAYVDFLSETGFKVRLSEHMKIASVNGLKFGMTVDREGVMEVSGKQFPAIADLKCGATVPDYTAIQLAFYDIGLGYPPEGKVQRYRFAVQLKPDGTFKIYPYDERGDYGAASGMIAATSWKMNKGYIKL